MQMKIHTEVCGRVYSIPSAFTSYFKNALLKVLVGTESQRAISRLWASRGEVQACAVDGQQL